MLLSPQSRRFRTSCLLLATHCLRRSVLASAMPRVDRSGLAGLLFFLISTTTTALVAPKAGFRQQAARLVKGYNAGAANPRVFFEVTKSPEILTVGQVAHGDHAGRVLSSRFLHHLSSSLATSNPFNTSHDWKSSLSTQAPTPACASPPSSRTSTPASGRRCSSWLTSCTSTSPRPCRWCRSSRRASGARTFCAARRRPQSARYDDVIG